MTDTTAENRKKLIKSGFLMIMSLILIVLFLWILLTRGWFAKPSSSQSPVDVNVQDVDYTVKNIDKTISGENIFTPRFYIDEINDKYDNNDEGDEDVPATGVNKIVKYDDSTVTINGTTQSIALNASMRYKAILTPYDATTHETWSSSDETIATVTKYGRVRGRKVSDTLVTITATVNGNSKSFQVKVTATEGDTDELSYVPANTNILLDENPIVLINKSTVNTKLRAIIEVEYKDLTGDEAPSVERTIKTTAQIKNKLGVSFLDWNYSGQGPLVEESEGWQKYNKSRGYFTMFDENGYAWNVKNIYVTESEFSNLTENSIKNVSYVNKMETMLYFGNNSDSDDYGDIIPPVDGETSNDIQSFTSIMLTDTYTSFSTRKGLAIKITYQARQSDYFVTNSSGNKSEDGWYDVFTCNYEQ